MKAKRIVLALICMLIILRFSDSAIAEIMTFVKEYTYQASEADSKLTCRAIALVQVKKLLLEELGTYLESETQVKDFQLTKDQITILTAGIVQAEIINETWDGKIYHLNAKIMADPENVAKAIDSLRQDRLKTELLKRAQRKADKLLREIDRLRQEITSTKANSEKNRLYKETVDALGTTSLSEKGIALLQAGKYLEAKEVFNKLIKLDPEKAEGYYLRGIVYSALGQTENSIKDYNEVIKLHQKIEGEMDYFLMGLAHKKVKNYKQAINYFDKAIGLNPKNDLAYYSRGLTYIFLGKYQQAINDFNRGKEINPKNPMCYNGLGTAHAKLGNYLKAINYCDMAIVLFPRYVDGYHTRGIIYQNLGNNQQAISDFSEAIKLNPYYSPAYYSRGDAYANLKSYQKAISDYSKVIKFDPKYSYAYRARGCVYLELGDSHKAINDLKTAARMGNKHAQDLLILKGISW